MKKSLLTLILIAAVSAPLAVSAQDSAIVVETDSHSVFEGLFRSVWARLRALNPSLKQSAAGQVVFTAGIRGAESTDTLLKPYWKDDLTRDEAFQAELQQFSLAQLKLDQGELGAAVESFDGFIAAYAQSDLRPNALFGKSISLAGLGDNEQSLATMRQFVDENPNHPLVDDANLVIEELN